MWVGCGECESTIVLDRHTSGIPMVHVPKEIQWYTQLEETSGTHNWGNQVVHVTKEIHWCIRFAKSSGEYNLGGRLVPLFLRNQLVHASLGILWYI